MIQESDKKYIILEDETIVHNGHTLYRIQALKDFSNVKKDSKGGWISGYHNLSQQGDCWIYNEAKVYELALVFEDACISNYAEIYGNAQVFNEAKVWGNAKVYGNSNVYKSARVCENAEIYNFAKIYGYSHITGKAKIYNNAEIFEYAWISDSSQIFGGALISGHLVICGDAIINNISDYIVFKNHWSSGRYFIYTKSNKMWKVGCFYGTGEELIKKAYQDNELSGKMYEYYVNFVKLQEKK